MTPHNCPHTYPHKAHKAHTKPHYTPAQNAHIPLGCVRVCGVCGCAVCLEEMAA